MKIAQDKNKLIVGIPGTGEKITVPLEKDEYYNNVSAVLAEQAMLLTDRRLIIIDQSRQEKRSIYRFEDLGFKFEKFSHCLILPRGKFLLLPEVRYLEVKKKDPHFENINEIVRQTKKKNPAEPGLGLEFVLYDRQSGLELFERVDRQNLVDRGFELPVECDTYRQTTLLIWPFDDRGNLNHRGDYILFNSTLNKTERQPKDSGVPVLARKWLKQRLIKRIKPLSYLGEDTLPWYGILSKLQEVDDPLDFFEHLFWSMYPEFKPLDVIGKRRSWDDNIRHKILQAFNSFIFDCWPVLSQEKKDFILSAIDKLESLPKKVKTEFDYFAEHCERTRDSLIDLFATKSAPFCGLVEYFLGSQPKTSSPAYFPMTIFKADYFILSQFRVEVIIDAQKSLPEKGILKPFDGRIDFYYLQSPWNPPLEWEIVEPTGYPPHARLRLKFFETIARYRTGDEQSLKILLDWLKKSGGHMDSLGLHNELCCTFPETGLLPIESKKVGAPEYQSFFETEFYARWPTLLKFLEKIPLEEVVENIKDENVKLLNAMKKWPYIPPRDERELQEQTMHERILFFARSRQNLLMLKDPAFWVSEIEQALKKFRRNLKSLTRKNNTSPSALKERFLSYLGL
ncbi:hypothetical protein ACFL35_05790 [Candidatus Riflebacteria bacterium]